MADVNDFVTLFGKWRVQAGFIKNTELASLFSDALVKHEKSLEVLDKAIQKNWNPRVMAAFMRADYGIDTDAIFAYLNNPVEIALSVNQEMAVEADPEKKEVSVPENQPTVLPVLAPEAGGDTTEASLTASPADSAANKPVETETTHKPAEGELVGRGEEKATEGEVVIPGPISRPKTLGPNSSQPEKASPKKTSSPQLEITEAEESGFKSWLKGRQAAIGEWRAGLGSGSSSSQEKKSGGAAKWAFGILAVLILLISGGVLWRIGTENGEYNSSVGGSTTSLLNLSACTTADGLPGVTRYSVMPNFDIVGRSGYVDSSITIPYDNSALVFEQSKSYQAVIVGNNYRVGLGTDVSVYAPISSFTQVGSDCVQELAIEVLTSGIENQQRASVQLAYKIDFTHWSGLLVVLSLISILGFTAITLFMSGGKIKDFVLMMVVVSGTGFFTSKSDWEPSTFFLFYVFIYVLTVAVGSKSELQEQSDSFNAGNQLKLPQSMETLFKSLSRGWGIVGGYDWSQSAIYSALMMFVGAVYPSASPLVRALDSQIMAIGIGALFVVFSCAMEAWRRGLLGDWIAFGLGFIGLLDFGIYYSSFGSNPPNIFDFSPSALAVLGWTATFIVAVLANFGAQAASERTELQRDRMADGMLFFSAMKLVAILGYIFYFLM